jgi:hypothetical protein
VGKTWKEDGALAQNRIQCAPEGVKGNNSSPNNVGRGVSSHFRNKKREYLKEKINELAKQ